MIKLNDILEDEPTEEVIEKIKKSIFIHCPEIGTDFYESKVYLYSPNGLSVGVDFEGTTIKAIIKLAKYLSKN